MVTTSTRATQRLSEILMQDMAWFEDDLFWKTFGHCMFTEAEFTAAGEQCSSLIELIGGAGGSVLDLGSGPGRFSIPLAEQGCQVTALDISPSLIADGQRRAAEAGVEIDWVQGDMRHFERSGQYDLIVSLWTSFGYFDSEDDDLAVLVHCHDNLKPGGQLLIDTTGKEYVCRHIQPVHLTEYDDGRLLIERPVLTHQMSRYSNEWLLIDGDRVDRAEWHHNLYTASELRQRVESAGFDEIEIYGSLSGEAYDLDAERLVVLARRT